MLDSVQPAVSPVALVSADALEELTREGYAVVQALVTPEQVERALEQIYSIVPSPEEFAKQVAEQGPDAVNFYAKDMPWGGTGTGLADLAVCEQVIDYVERRLGTKDIEITQALLFAKYPGKNDFEQALHVDYGNNVLDYPRNDPPYRSAQAIIYLTDVDEDHGPTYAVPWSVTGDEPVEFVLDRDKHTDIYAQEKPATGKAGCALLYTMSTYHRGSSYRATDGARFTLHLVYKNATNRALNWNGWAKTARAAGWGDWVSTLTPRQRQVFGFAAPGEPYWNARTIAGVARGYPGMDMTPYIEAAGTPL